MYIVGASQVNANDESIQIRRASMLWCRICEHVADSATPPNSTRFAYDFWPVASITLQHCHVHMRWIAYTCVESGG
jgi:hypothetical protein